MSPSESLSSVYMWANSISVENMRDISKFLTIACEDIELHCLAITGNDDFYDVTQVGDYDAIGESLYFALTRDIKLFDMVSETVRIAAEILEVE